MDTTVDTPISGPNKPTRPRRLGMSGTIVTSQEEAIPVPIPSHQFQTMTSLLNLDLNTVDASDIHIQCIDDELPVPPAVTMKKKNPKKRWMWTDSHVSALLQNILSYKQEKTYRGLDFECDLVAFYADIRKMMAEAYPPSDFGPVQVPNQNSEDMDREQLLELKKNTEKLEKQKKDGYTRIKTKIKELRQGYKAAVDQGTRSGSGRLVKENFDILKEIWQGSPSVNSITGGMSSSTTVPIRESLMENEIETDEEEPILDIQDNTSTGSTTSVPQPDPKRRKLEKKLSAHQRDMLLIQTMDKELALKKKSIEVMQESIAKTNETMIVMSKSMENLGSNVKEGLTMIAKSFVRSNPVPQMFSYQTPNLSHCSFASQMTPTARMPPPFPLDDDLFEANS